MRFPQKEFDIQFDPSKTDPAKMVSAIQGLGRGYRAKLSRPVAALVKGAGLTLQGIADRSAYKAGAKAKVKVSFKPDRKKKITKLTAKVVVDDVAAKGESKEIKSKKGAVLKVTLGDKKGPGHVKVEVSYELDGKSHTSTIEVPVVIG